jgi:hypothetical protein
VAVDLGRDEDLGLQVTVILLEELLAGLGELHRLGHDDPTANLQNIGMSLAPELVRFHAT